MPKQHANATTIFLEDKLRAFYFECLYIDFVKGY